MEERSSAKSDALQFRMPGVGPLRLHLTISKAISPLSSTILLAYGFAGLILLGTALLIMPFSASSGQFTSPIDALFTATSAVSVTGLAVVDTASHWSVFGQVVIFILFQIGGLGFVIGATILLLALGRRFGLREKLLITESIGTEQLEGVLKVVTGVAIFSAVAEGLGIAVLYWNWSTAGDTSATPWALVFHAASAFTNSGLTIFTTGDLSRYQGDNIVLLTTALLVILGGTSYVIIADIVRKRNYSRLALDSKIVLATSFSLVLAGTIFYLLLEFAQPGSLGPVAFPQKVMVAFFQSVVPRSAGLTAVDIASMRQVTLFFTMFLMFIGGAPGSVTGGVKVSTLAVVVITAVNLLRGRESIEIFGRQLTRQTVYRAVTLVICYLGVISFLVVVLSFTEVFPVDSIIFEAFSAVGTVGLTTGITPELSTAGRLIIIVAMFIGRIGPLSLMAILDHRKQPSDIAYPQETIRLG